ncbi:hypothetical protein ISF_03014 [Cordyceps fumosorosea ARSEF 2679]|uniref:Peroxin 11C n=1 Tax=Cordyceps fumosorosea (strain ARSEF 2679) TaxID=1081104 RepID=A0A162LF39_CORFA|nr:hypothetical protein ISF_03014 [Cordyceps fumosorosea ARSEF 2679]OAA69744.1 hypothetical protein ISF_03014 [Cordyceps fumosorosea ARSEF 2679]
MSEPASEALALVEPVEPVAVLPSSEPSEKAAATTTTAAAPTSSPPAPRRLSALARADDFLAHLQRCMQTRAGADTVLMFACYATRLAGNALDIGGHAALRSSARQLVAALFSLPPATTVVLDSAAATPPAIRAVLDLAQRLLAYSGMISEMRTMGRLWGLLGLYSALKGLVAKTFAARGRKSSNDPLSDEAAEKTFDGLVAWAQMLCLVAFQACENAAYLGSKKILPIKPLNQGKLALLSVRFWGAYVAMEVARHLVERGRKLSAAGGVVKTAEERRWQEGWRKAFYRNAAWAPLTMHWGTPGGLMPDFLVALFALYPATGGMRDLWRSTA